MYQAAFECQSDCTNCATCIYWGGGRTSALSNICEVFENKAECLCPDNDIKITYPRRICDNYISFTNEEMRSKLREISFLKKSNDKSNNELKNMSLTGLECCLKQKKDLEKFIEIAKRKVKRSFNDINKAKNNREKMVYTGIYELNKIDLEELENDLNKLKIEMRRDYNYDNID